MQITLHACRIQFYMNSNRFRVIVKVLVHAINGSRKFNARLIGQVQGHTIAHLDFRQIFLKNIQVAFHSLGIPNLHQRSLHISITAQTGCHFAHDAGDRCTQRECCGKLAFGYSGSRNAHLCQLATDAQHVGMSHMIILLGLLQAALDAGTILSKQLLALHILSGKFTLLGS